MDTVRPSWWQRWGWKIALVVIYLFILVPVVVQGCAWWWEVAMLVTRRHGG